METSWCGIFVDQAEWKIKMGYDGLITGYGFSTTMVRVVVTLLEQHQQLFTIRTLCPVFVEKILTDQECSIRSWLEHPTQPLIDGIP